MVKVVAPVLIGGSRIHWARICANSWPHGVWEYQRSAFCSTSSSASTVSNDPRCRYRLSTSEAVNERRGKVTSKQLVDHPVALRTNSGGRACSRMSSDDQTYLGSSRRQGNRRAIVERSCHAALWMSIHVIWSTSKCLLDRLQIQQVIGATSGNNAETS